MSLPNNLRTQRMRRVQRYFNEKGEEMVRFICSPKVNKCRLMRQAGDYLLGPRLGNSPVKSVVVCLAKKIGTDDFYSLKMLTIKDELKDETQDDKQGKMLIYTEYALLSLLHNQKGIAHHYGLLRSFVRKEAVKIFYDTICIVSDLHKQNIVHRDLKLGNIVLNKKTEGKPYLGKPSDMWAMGVVLFYHALWSVSFYDSVPQELFRKIKAAEYNIQAKRMTADQVLDSLSCILASWQLTMSLENDFQIVPEQSPTKESKEDNNASKRPLPIDLDSTSDFDAVVVNWEVEKPSIKAPKVSRSLYPKSKSVSISYMSEDEKKLTVADIQKYQHLLPSSSSH
ncbi:hypothetical protein CEXT_400971 [Caerostris extrusa]|uniref:Protein kinase domain-containing protein n=1 Tax=Caerostris extrusa TaxID=172846 RepID=A0AAV4UVP0_CAEEX|nr:hypothetical protein CEXT_400971 [Caerostris extrusa]